jgi:thiol-disulfide isomerase/thioredoxin
MKIIRVIFVCIICSFKVQGKAVKIDTISGPNLTVGDEVPDAIFKRIINGPDVIKLSDFRGKLLLLDLFSTYCGSCIEAFPKLEQLQKKFSTDLKILLVTDQSKSQIEHFLNQWKKLTGKSTILPIITEDSVLNIYFKHNSVPNYIWIDQSGVLRGITRGDEVTTENVNSIIHYHHPIMEQKTDSSLAVNYIEPLFIRGNGTARGKPIWYSILTKADPLITSISGVFLADSNRSVIMNLNDCAKGLYQVAFNDYKNEYWLPDNRVIIKMKDTSRMVWKINGVPQKQNALLYQLSAPKRPIEEMHKLMQQDLKRYFGLDAEMVKKEMVCWVLKCDDTSVLKTAGSWHRNEYDYSNFKLILSNVSVKEMNLRFIYNLLDESPLPFINDIAYHGNIDLTLDNVAANDPNSLIKALAIHKMRLVKETRLVKVLIIKDSGYNNLNAIFSDVHMKGH